MIRQCKDRDFEDILAVVNDGAQAYKDVIPQDRWKEHYMPREELQLQMEGGVAFWGHDVEGSLVGVMGIQPVQDVTLIRHSYVRSDFQKRGIGKLLLEHLLGMTDTPVLIGTWAAASWAIRFYERNGFRQVSPEEKDRLLRRYWKIPERQVETSVVLADAKWREVQG